MKLTDTQLVLLSAAAQREDGAIEIGPKLKGSAARQVLGKLLSEHLIEEIPAQGTLPVWRRDGQRGSVRAAYHRVRARRNRRRPGRRRHQGRRSAPLGENGEAGTALAAAALASCRFGSQADRKGSEARPSRPRRIEAGGGNRHAAGPARCDNRGHHEGDR